VWFSVGGLSLSLSGVRAVCVRCVCAVCVRCAYGVCAVCVRCVCAVCVQCVYGGRVVCVVCVVCARGGRVVCLRCTHESMGEDVARKGTERGDGLCMVRLSEDGWIYRGLTSYFNQS
jgi:hypothetical protein